MKVAIRADSSFYIGSGHISRCLTLAEYLREKGAEVFFITRNLDGNSNSVIINKGFQVLIISSDKGNDSKETIEILEKEGPVKWVIVDHYKLDFRWEEMVRKHAKYICVIDDLADRRHDCDILLDQNYYEDYLTRYDGLVPEKCLKLLGLKYLLLRSEFIAARNKFKDTVLKRIFIFFGGSDHTNQTMKTLRAITKLNDKNLNIDVVVGLSNKNKKAIMEQCKTMGKACFYCQIDNIAEVMSYANLAIGAGGLNLWERCYMVLPSIIITTGTNQIKTAEAAAKFGAAIDLGWYQNVSVEAIEHTLRKIIEEKSLLEKMTKRTQDMVGQLLYRDIVKYFFMEEMNSV